MIVVNELKNEMVRYAQSVIRWCEHVDKDKKKYM